MHGPAYVVTWILLLLLIALAAWKKKMVAARRVRRRRAHPAECRNEERRRMGRSGRFRDVARHRVTDLRDRFASVADSDLGGPAQAQQE